MLARLVRRNAPRLLKFGSPAASWTAVRCLANTVQQAYTGSGSPGVGVLPRVPTRVEDIEPSNVLAYGSDLDADHPGFRDPEYRARRKMITDLVKQHRRLDDPLPVVNYTPVENQTWTVVYDKLSQLYPTHACRQFNQTLDMLKYSRNEIPQLAEVNEKLKAATGFRLRPVAGLLSSRDFLNGLAFRVFHSTQYIRHHSKPFYTPEPDVCHELLGHVPMLMDPEFAELSEQIGKASLGVSDEDITHLSTVYWFSVEFGLLVEDGFLRAYGAGLLSSYGELWNALSGKPEYRPFDPPVTALQPFPITTYQPILYVAQSLARATEQLRQYAGTLKRVQPVA